MTIEDYTINISEPIREALKRLNLVKSRSMTLFVVDDNGVMVGTLTDGDVRRALIAGHEVNSPVVVAGIRSGTDASAWHSAGAGT